jgi:hypothetical protein
MAPKSAMDVTVKVGTRFRKAYADGNPLWEVESITGQHASVVSINEPFEHNGVTFESDYAGIKQSVLLSEIRQLVAFEGLLGRSVKKSDDFWKRQALGTVLHYHDSFGRYVRGEVVAVGRQKMLKPTALVGAWAPGDLARRMPNGTVYLGYHAKKISEGAAWAPHDSTVFESPSFSERRGVREDPRTMAPLNLELDEPTPQEKIRHMQEGVIQSVVKSLQDTSVSVEDRLAAAIDALRDAL